jgi:putative flippase GtrA
MQLSIDTQRWHKLGCFLVVGGSGVLVNSVALHLLYGLLGLPFIVASAVSVELAIVNNFLWNDLWTFARSRGSRARRFARFNTASLVALAITTSSAWLLVHGMGLHYLVANMIGIGLASVCNFATSVCWTWQK